MNYSKLRAKTLVLLENTLYQFRHLGGRISNLYKLLRNRKQYVTAKSYYPEVDLKDKKTILKEQIRHVLRYGEINSHYFAMGFDRKDKKDINQYLSVRKMDHVRYKKNYILPEYEDYNFICLLTDKFAFGSFCRGLGIPTPSNVGIIDEEQIQLIERKQILPLEHIKTLTVDAYCKIISGLQGKGTFHLEIRDSVIFRNGKEISFDELKQILSGNKWIVQERISDQHELLQQLHPHSINTIRILTVKSGKAIEVVTASLRMGVNGSKVDNWSAGGILIGIDLEKGELNKWGFFKPGKGTKTGRHPDSGIIFEGYKVPFFHEALALAKHSHALMPGIHSVGWDIAITKNGPIVVEGNSKWDTTLYQVLEGGFKEPFDKYFLEKKTAGHKNYQMSES